MQDLASLGEEGECISASTEEDIPFGLLKYIFCSSFFFFFLILPFQRELSLTQNCNTHYVQKMLPSLLPLIYRRALIVYTHLNIQEI